MKYYNINKSMVGLVLMTIVVCTSCKKTFLDVNEETNRSTDKNISAALLFPQGAHGIGARLASGNLRFLNNWIGYFAAPGDFSIQQDETSYNVDFSFGDALWSNSYNALFDLYLTRVKALGVQDSVLAGCAMVLSARLFQDLVDIYGNLPYSQAFQTTVYRQPAFDKAEDVYKALQASLDTAIIYFTKGTPTDKFGDVDIVNHGNVDKWIRFANTLKLRLLIHQSERAGFDPTAELQKITDNGGVLLAGENISVNPGYVNDENKQSPFYANYGLTPAGNEASTSTRANDYMVNLLLSTDDIRITRFYQPVGTSYVGDTYGLVEGNPLGAASSKIGPGLAGSATQGQWIFPSFESLFLQAEAEARGWLPGNTQQTYETAVTESFAFLKVPDTVNEARDYLDNTDIANWANAGSSISDQVKFIGYQKYIALCGIDPVEAWVDLRRIKMLPNSGYISHNPSKISTFLPYRLLYPQSEYTANSANVRAQGDIKLFETKLFWQP